MCNMSERNDISDEEQSRIEYLQKCMTHEGMPLRAMDDMAAEIREIQSNSGGEQ